MLVAVGEYVTWVVCYSSKIFNWMTHFEIFVIVMDPSFLMGLNGQTVDSTIGYIFELIIA